jgi:hypothetical protein
VKCGECLKVGDYITYQCEIGNLGYYTSKIRKKVLEDENPLKLSDWGYVWYHNAQIQKCKNLVNCRLEKDNPAAKVWREVAEFHLEAGEAEDYYTKKYAAALQLSAKHQRLSDGISDMARRWGLPNYLM